MSVFAKERVNFGRQTEADLLRGFTALGLIIIHEGLYLGTTANGAMYTFCDIYGSEFFAPVFMVLMGMSIVFSQHQIPATMLKRGVSIFILAYILNFFRSILPMLIFGNIHIFASIQGFFVIDIYQLAGLSFMLIALLKKLKLPNVVILLISIVMVIIDQFLMLPASVAWDSELLTGFVNLFCPVTAWSCFPLLTWFFFPAVGLILGDLVVKCTDKKRLYAIMLLAGLAGVLYVYYQFHSLYPNYTSYYFGNAFYWLGLKNAILTVFFVCFALGLWFFIDKIIPKFIRTFLIFLSKNLSVFYVTSWLIVTALMCLQGIYGWTFSNGALIILFIVSDAFCVVITKLFVMVKKKVIKKRA